MYRSTHTEREREDGDVKHHHAHEFSFSSDAVQERSARTFTALTYKPDEEQRTAFYMLKLTIVFL